MKITIISGSHRENSQSTKVAKHYQKVMLNNICDEAPIIDLASNPLPLWDEGIWDGEEKWTSLLAPYREQLSSSDGFVVITPEWHGQVPAGLKNFFLIFGRNELGNKPAKIVSISSADGGAYPIAELRMSSYKNSRLCYIPEQMIIRNVEKVLNDKAEDNDESADSYFRERIEWSLNILKEYVIALKQVRDSGATDTDKFGNGM
ncbi:MAG: NADPH-dependent oxidoreductase [endosymbiont of Galathealinum brachiosum]|uniref:NADPH-dependent oxidoreductase n=1 Tax=endosymbiont of Galathealinum brachiosum TaxID=2200906 RepID=A0A370DG85_9GAMM|nr:MAG: NADPH-dependent oxidoreductase [endosymbiont of Galathealinum brachiosum]